MESNPKSRREGVFLKGSPDPIGEVQMIDTGDSENSLPHNQKQQKSGSCIIGGKFNDIVFFILKPCEFYAKKALEKGISGKLFQKKILMAPINM